MNAVTHQSVRSLKVSFDVLVADAAAALVAADDKLGQAFDDFDEDAKSSLDLFDINGARLVARAVVRMLVDVDGRPMLTMLPGRVFDAFASHGNTKDGNTPHLEGAILAVELAENCLARALEMMEQLDGEEVDEAYETHYAAYCIVGHVLSSISGGALVFNRAKAMEAILEPKRERVSAGRHPLAVAA